MNDHTILFIILTVALFFLLRWLYKTFKIPKMGTFNLITGGVKSGKSLTCVWASKKIYKKRVKMWKFKCFLCKIFRRVLPEKPLYYSNVKIAGVDCVMLTDELIARLKRFNYGSVIYIQECSIFADSMSFKYLDNDALLLLCKLIGHETRGGAMFLDTQSISDCHFAIKRCVSNYFDIHRSVDVPFFKIVYLREMRWSDDGNIMNVFDDDVEESLKRCIIPKKYLKDYDCFAYSALTDNLPVESDVTVYDRKSDLKVHEIVRAQKPGAIKKLKNKELKENENTKK